MDFLVDYLLNFYGPTPYLIIFLILLACGLGIPIPEDITLFAAGLMTYYGITNLWVVIPLCLVGVLAGDTMIFYFGSRFGRRLTKKWFFHKMLPDAQLETVRKKFNQKGEKLLFAARFMPGLRAPIYFSAGTLHVPFRKFLLYDGSAALISVPTIIGAVYYFGDEVDSVIRVIRGVQHSIFIFILAIILAIAGKWYITHRKIKVKNRSK